MRKKEKERNLIRENEQKKDREYERESTQDADEV